MFYLKVFLLVCFFGRLVKTYPTYDYESDDEGDDYLDYDAQIEPVLLDDDIILDDRQFVVGPKEKNKYGSWQLLNSERFLWPKGVIPYTIDNDFSDHQKGLINKAMKHISSRSCITFFKNAPKRYRHFVHIVKPQKPNLCNSFVGKVGKGEQVLNLGDQCFDHEDGKVIHELLHAAGFWHEHGRPDRDTFLNVVWDEVANLRIPSHNFDRRNWGFMVDACDEYDHMSIMHYGTGSYMTLKQPPTDGPAKFVGQRLGMSRMDIRKLNRMYGCHEDCGTDCKPPYNIKDHTRKCTKIRPEKHQQCLKDLALLMFCY